MRNPSLWYEFHVCGKSFNARGLGVPGSPGLLIGWNEHLAWGATAPHRSLMFTPSGEAPRTDVRAPNSAKIVGAIL